LVPTSTRHSEQTFLPAAQRQGIALCLSGGGFRAALFHLGALRRLNELRILSRVDTITSVSGGSIISAHLATQLKTWPASDTVAPNWDALAQSFREFTSKDLRTGVILKRTLPWNWFDSATGVKGLEAAYKERLTPLRIAQLPARPRFVFCSTDMSYGVNWTFTRERTGDYQAGYMIPPVDWPLARAVAASSCFPPVFDPLPIDVQPTQLSGGRALAGPARSACIKDLRLSDGGVYDNMGLEPVWKSAATVLVSDGGGVFTHSGDDGWFWRLGRYIDIQGNQGEALRKRWLMSNFNATLMSGAYWGIGSFTGHYGHDAPKGYSETLVDERISNIRTDLDAFSEAEASVLENHGYLLTDAAITTHAPQLVAVSAKLSVPNSRWMDEATVRNALKESGKRKLPFGRSGA
jgi:NTE family protein